MSHPTTLSELLGTIASRRAFLKRSVAIYAAIPVVGSVLAACGDDANDDAPAAACGDESTAAAAPAAKAAISPITQANATQSPPVKSSGQLAFYGAPEGVSPNSIYLVDSDGAAYRPVWGWPTAESYAIYFEWSPDGRHLAFFGHDASLDAASGGYSALFWLVPEQGQTTNLNLTHLRDVGYMWGPPTWSSDSRLVYVSMPPPTIPEGTNPNAFAGIMAFAVDASAVPNPMLITLQDLDMQTPTLRVSPDGQTVVALIDEPPQLVVVRIDDPQTRIVAAELPVGGFPIWSPDSRRLAFIGLSPDGIGQLYVVNADGTGLSQLTDFQPPNGVTTGGTEATPAWSPDGQQIAYTVHDCGTQQVYISAVDGSDTRNLSNDPAWADTGPNWSPDGSEIAVISRPAEAWRAGEEPVIRDIRVITADGTDSWTVVAGVQGIQFDPFAQETTGQPKWRPVTL